VAAKTAEARLVREAIEHEPQVFLQRLPHCRLTDIQPFALAALLAADVDEHRCRLPYFGLRDGALLFDCGVFFNAGGVIAGVGVAADPANMEWVRRSSSRASRTRSTSRGWL